MKNFKNKRVSVEIKDLEKLGWDFDFDYENVAKAKSISIDEAKVYENENYHIEISIKGDGYTSWRVVNTKKKAGGIDEGSDSEHTGDDEQTLKDLELLKSKDLLWDIIDLE